MTDHHERYFCKVCATDDLSEEAMKLINEYIATLKMEDCVAEEAYERRLEQCSLCSALVSGSTCRYCGCIVVVRAKKKAMDCPHPAGSRW